MTQTTSTETTNTGTTSTGTTSSETSTETEYDLSSSEYRANPFPTYALMRREAPIYSFVEDGPVPWTRGRVWYVFRYADSVEVLRDTNRYVKDFQLAFTPQEIGEMPEMPYFVRAIADSLIAKENPEHGRLRRLVNEPFSARIVERRRSDMERIVEDLIDAVEEQGSMDLIGDFAFQLPITVITTMLGLPPEDGPRLREWAADNAGAPRTEEEMRSSSERMESLFEYLREELTARRREPRDDLMSALLEAESDGRRLDDEEMLSMIGLIVGAGFETTMSMIGNAVLNLLRHPEAKERLAREPQLIGTAFEELQRYEGSVYAATPRWVAEDVDFHGHQLLRGDRIFPMILSANRDEEQFSDADRLDLERHPNRHIGFGLGPHFCLGGPLARIESQVAINALLRRLPDLRLAVPEEELEWIDSPIIHGPKKMPVTWD